MTTRVIVTAATRAQPALRAACATPGTQSRITLPQPARRRSISSTGERAPVPRLFSRGTGALITAALALILAMACGGSAFALGITPVHSSAVYMPNAEYRGSFNVINPEGFDLVNVYAESDMDVAFKSATIQLGGLDGRIDYVIALQGERPSPGDHEVKIFIEPALNGDVGVSARVRLAHKLTIAVPLEGPFLTATIDARQDDDSVVLESFVSNVGGADASLVALFTLTPVNSDDQLLNATTYPQLLGAGESATINVSVPASRVPYGDYDADLLIRYNGMVVNASHHWRHGSARMSLRQAPTEARANDLTQLVIGLHSDWNQPIRDATVDLLLMDASSNTVRTVTSESVNLAPFGDAVVTPVLDARGLQAQNMTLVVRVNTREGKQEFRQSLQLVNATAYTRVVPADVLQDESSLWLTALVMAALLLIVIIVVNHARRPER